MVSSGINRGVEQWVALWERRVGCSPTASFHAERRGGGCHTKRGGFTLIELLVVMAIIGVLIGILVPYLTKPPKLARALKCQANLKQILVGMQCYADQNNGRVVPMNQVDWRYGHPDTNEKWYTNSLDDAGCLGEKADFDNRDIGGLRWCPSSIWTCPSVGIDEKGWGNGYGLNELHVHHYPARDQFYGGALPVSRVRRQSEIFSVADSRVKIEGNWRTAFGIHPPCTDSLPTEKCGDGSCNHPPDDPQNCLPSWENGGQQVAPRHLGKVNLGFFDGHVDSLSYEDCKDNHRNMFAEDKNGDGRPDY